MVSATLWARIVAAFRWFTPGWATPRSNLVYRKTTRSFNPMMATAGRVTVAEVEHLVQPGGSIRPHHHAGVTSNASCTFPTR